MNETFSKEMDVPLRVGTKGFLAKLRYTSDDPHAVTLAVPCATPSGSEWVVWEFHRDLLYQGLRGQAGDGDIQIRPGRNITRVMITLRGVTFDCAAPLLVRFTTGIFEAVPAGREHEWIDFDREINELLEQA